MKKETVNLQRIIYKILLKEKGKKENGYESAINSHTLCEMIYYTGYGIYISKRNLRKKISGMISAGYSVGSCYTGDKTGYFVVFTNKDEIMATASDLKRIITIRKRTEQIRRNRVGKMLVKKIK